MRYLMLMLCLLVANVTRAETIIPGLAKADPCGRFEVVHINGILTEPDGAQANLMRLIAEYGNAHKGHFIWYALAYNQTRGVARDFADSFAQVTRDMPGATFGEWINNVVFGMTTSTMTAARAQTIGQRYADLFGFVRPTQYQSQDLADIVLAIRQSHIKHGKLLLVAHSQGNLYANLVHDQLMSTYAADFPRQSVLMAHVANPATTLRTGNYHVTTQYDVVMKAVRWAVPLTPAPNVNVPFTLSDKLGHNFIQIYMTLPAARDAVKAMVANRLDALRTTAPDPQEWARSVGSMYYCGTLPAWYGPGPWQCPFTNGQTYITNTIQAPIAGSPNMDMRSGTLAMAEAAARLHATGCQQLFVNDRIAQAKAGTYILRDIPGCGYSFPGAHPYAYSAGLAWRIYSADSTQVRVTYELYPPIQYVQSGIDTAKVETFPMCRRT